MPKFSNVGNEYGSGLENLFKDSPSTAVVDDLMKKYRSRAAEILRTGIPEKIKHLETLIASEADPLSLLWTGAVESGDYVAPRRAQPGDILACRVALEGVKQEDVVMPGDLTLASTTARTAKGLNGDTPNGHAAVGEDATIVAPHYFEVVPGNEKHTELIRISVKEFEVLHMMVQDLKIWLEMEIPLIEDGNSFGAEVQAHLIRELDTAYKKANAFHNGSRSHWSDRTKLIYDWVKYPNVMDYPSAIAASDRFDHFLIRSYLRSMLVIYAGLLTKFERNWAKVINPKGSAGGGTGGMY